MSVYYSRHIIVLNLKWQSSKLQISVSIMFQNGNKLLMERSEIYRSSNTPFLPI